jgi:DegV family protein with EDD domain
MEALRMAEDGASAAEIKEFLESTRSDSSIYIMVDTLTYLKKGGRITPTAAALGGMLKLKPVLIIEGEKLDKYRMRNRSLDNAEKIMIDAIEKDVNGFLKDLDGRSDNIKYEIAYTGTDTTDAMEFKKMVMEHFGCKDVVVNPLSLSVSCHIGPGAIALAVCKDLPEKYNK